MKKCTLALGCFWKPEENFKNKLGIIETEVGYAGGKNPNVRETTSAKGNSLNPINNAMIAAAPVKARNA